MRLPAKPVVLLIVLSTALIGCRSVYYGFWEKLGREKRDLLRSNVEAARDEQQEAGEQFKDALTHLKELYGFQGGDLEKSYNSFKADYERCAGRADAVRSRIQKVEKVGEDLFREWETEIQEISNAGLRTNSREKLVQTRRKYDSLLASMRRAEQGMAPVLTQFNDYVLYLKHNLNAQALGALKAEAFEIESEISKLIRDMNASISEADSFVRALP